MLKRLVGRLTLNDPVGGYPTMLPDLLGPGLKLVVCGSAAGAVSARRGQYYAGPGNKFWRTLAEIGLTPRQLSPAEYPELLGFGIGLTDFVKGQAGSDRDLRFEPGGREGLSAKIQMWQPRYLCFNGKRAAQQFLQRADVGYGPQSDRVGATQLFVAPSTSGAASGFWNLESWRKLAVLVG